MPLNRALVGREYGPSEVYEVGREHVRQFAQAVGEHSPLHTDAGAARAAGYADVVAPPTFLTTLTFRFAADSPTVDPELGLDYSRVVHGTQEFRFSRPVVAGDRLRMTTQRRRHPGGRRSRVPRDRVRRRRRRRRARRHPRRDRRVAGDRSEGGPLMPALEDVSVGDALGPLEVAVTREALIRYAGASGDYNTIHWNERVAKAVGLPDVIAHGMFTMASAARLVTGWAGDAGRVVGYAVRFSSPVVVPDDDTGTTLTVTGRVESLDPDERTAVVALDARTADGPVLKAARATVRLD